MDTHKTRLRPRTRKYGMTSAVRVSAGRSAKKTASAANGAGLTAQVQRGAVVGGGRFYDDWQAYKKPVIILIILVMVFVAGWWFFQQPVVRKTDHSVSWQACLLPSTKTAESEQEPMQPLLMEVPAGTYNLPAQTSGLFVYLEPYQVDRVVIKNDFLIQKQVMPRAVFAQYARFVEQLPAGEEKEQRQAHLGLLWNRAESTATAVQGLSWEGVMDFRDWLRQKTGCDYDLPAREEWLAAVLHLYNSGEQVPKAGDSYNPSPLDSLLRGGREWTRSSCTMGYYLVGEDKWVNGSSSNHAVCMPPLFTVAGFRLILNPLQQQEPSPPPSPPDSSSVEPKSDG